MSYFFIPIFIFYIYMSCFNLRELIFLSLILLFLLLLISSFLNLLLLLLPLYIYLLLLEIDLILNIHLLLFLDFQINIFVFFIYSSFNLSSDSSLFDSGIKVFFLSYILFLPLLYQIYHFFSIFGFLIIVFII